MSLTVDIIYVIVLTFVSYFTFFHLTLWLENRGKFFERRKNTDLPSVSILIPAYNEETAIDKTIKNIVKIGYPKDRLEILVIDDGSKDKTYKIAKKYESKIVKVFTKKNGGKANAINFGLKRAKNDFVVVMDADSLPSEDALINCMKYFDEDKVAAVTAHIMPKKINLLQKFQHIELMVVNFQRKLQESPNVINCTPGPFSVYRKDILNKVGGFDEKILVEDVEIAWRLLSKGYKIRMAFDAMVDCIYPYSFRMWWRQRTRWGIGGIQTLFKYIGHLFRKGSHGVGNFLVPTSIAGYSFTILGIGLFTYLVGAQVFNFSYYAIKSFSVGISPLNALSISYLLDFKRIYGLMVLFLFLITLKIASDVHKIKVNPLLVLLYMTIYATLYPLINLNAMQMYFRKKRGWLTK